MFVSFRRYVCVVSVESTQLININGLRKSRPSSVADRYVTLRALPPIQASFCFKHNGRIYISFGCQRFNSLSVKLVCFTSRTSYFWLPTLISELLRQRGNEIRMTLIITNCSLCLLLQNCSFYFILLLAIINNTHTHTFIVFFTTHKKTIAYVYKCIENQQQTT